MYKRVVTVHIISRRGATKLIIYTGRTNSARFQELGDQFLVPFCNQIYPEYHRIHMDSASFHVCPETKVWWDLNGLNHFKTPPQSPDLNSSVHKYLK